MALTEEEIISLVDAIHQAFEKPDKLEDFLDQHEDLKGKLVLEINHENCDNSFNKEVRYNQNAKQYKLLILEAANTGDIKYKDEYNQILLSINSHDCIIFKTDKDRNVVKDFQEFREKTIDEKYKICHFVGHGNNGIQLSNESIQPHALKSLFKSRPHFECVVFNACSSGKAAKQVSEYINYVIGMSQSINDDVAINFAKGFYDGLQYGINNNQDIFLTGFREGILAIGKDSNSQESIPVLYISYKQAILNLIKQLDAEDKIDDFFQILKHDDLRLNSSLIKFINSYKHPLRVYLNDFHEIIKRISNDSAIQSAYKKIFSDDIESDNNKIIDKLIVNDDQNSKIPLIVQFANNLASILKINKNAKSEEIQGWLDKIPDEFKVEINDEDESSPQTIYTYLLITVDDCGGDKFNLCAEYILEDENSKEIKRQSVSLENTEETVSLCNSFDEIPKQVEKYYEKLCNQLWNPQNINRKITITIELFLPMEYLKNNLDREWLINDGLGETQIIKEHNIIVRLRERLNPKFYIPLQNNFNRFNKNLKEYSDKDILDKEIEIINQESMGVKLDQIKEKKIGIKLISNDILQRDFFVRIIRGGILIAFWRICSIPEEGNLDHIDNYLTLELFNNNFRNLIEQMHALRKDNSCNDQTFYHLGFLCDNPNRIPSMFKRNNNLKPFN